MSGASEVRVSERAAAEIEEAADWWARNRPSAPNAVDEEFARAVALLSQHPRIGIPTTSRRVPELRRLYLERIRYHVYYRTHPTSSAVEILALWHTSRGLGPDL